MDTLSASHVMLKYYPGLKNVKYISNNYERTKVLFFLNKIYNGKIRNLVMLSTFSMLYGDLVE